MNYLKYFFLFLFALSIYSCDDDEMPDEIIEEELITTLTYTLTSTEHSATFTFTDLDGDGGNDPVVTADILKAGIDYTGTLTLLNESETPSEDITEEIAEEDDEHQLFFSNDLGLQINYTDTDGNNNPLGLATSVENVAIGVGTLTITLRHLPNKSAAGVSDGDITNAGGSTDIEVTFPLIVEE